MNGLKKFVPIGLSLLLTISIFASLTPTKKIAKADEPEKSTFFSTAYVEEADSYNTASDGDLWASCWADDGNLYSANGDGKGFSLDGPFADIAVNKITGVPPNLEGTTIARSDEVGQIWNDPEHYNRKPTGMVCVDGDLYLAVQDLNKDFNDVPSATIVKSTDKGKTWTWDETEPMFDDYTFTTIMFLDYGQDNENAKDEYIYAYGLDHNWRDSFNDRVQDPTKLYLGRVHKDQIQDRSQWEFYTGKDSNGTPQWSGNIEERQPVLQDDRRIYQDTFFTNDPKDMTVVSQGSIVYNEPLDRYLYTSWTEYTFEFYESPTPWGPWKRFLSKDYGGYPWTDTKNGGYATTIPSKFISADGKTMYVQSNTFMGGITNYNFSLRKLVIEPTSQSTPSNPKDSYSNLAITGEGTTPINKVAHFGNVDYFNNGIRLESEDSWNNERKTKDWWGYTWKKNYNLNKVDYTTGKMFPDGGWFKENLKVQVRQNHEWVDVSDLSVTPEYPYDNSAGPNKTYTFTFEDTWGDGVRIIGVPGGGVTFTSIGELAVYYADDKEPPNTKPFTINNGELSEEGGMLVNASVSRTLDTRDHEGKETVIFQLLKNENKLILWL
ncbi:DUF4185 domain-containing protein [Bacillus sp. Marseille-Q3570]|uniref:DUF4185 domain-containing protein n=1 Tax=Bacillus sp. Marseille-Q3570 TaxID=2963522 RepID=UPI0021B6F761|nr:DUF4185 domain-containing protein [Bacillus sp. Marseille-Q3570]